MAAGTVRVPPLLSQQRGLLSLPVPRVHNLQSSQQLNMDQGHCPAARPRLLRVGAHKYIISVVSSATYHDFTLVHFWSLFIFLYITVSLCCQLKQCKPFYSDLLHISRATQFRWIQKEGTGERQSWGVDHVYIGEACPGLCSGHGYCTSGVVCICDEGHHGGLQTAYYIQTARYTHSSFSFVLFRRKVLITV